MSTSPPVRPEPRNLGASTRPILRPAQHPDSDALAREHAAARALASKVDVLFVNPPTPDGAIWIRSQHRVGRRSRENMIWAQVSLAQLAALLHPCYTVQVIDAVAERLDWPSFEARLRQLRPRYYVTQVTAATLQNDLYGTFLAKAVGATTFAMGTHITPMPRETLGGYPTLDYGLRGEPDLTLRDLVDHLEGRQFSRPPAIEKLFAGHDPGYRAGELGPGPDGRPDLSGIKGLVWRQAGAVRVNPDRPFIADLDDLPMPMHHLLPLQKYRMPLVKGAYSFVVTSRGCPAGCKYCIKHVSYGPTIRLRSAARLVEEIAELHRLGIRNVHMFADLFTYSRAQVVELCERLLQSDLGIRWTCNSRVDFVDRELLALMKRAGCWCIAWGVESGSPEVLARNHKSIPLERTRESLQWSSDAGMLNWGYFIIGLPGETEATIRQTIAFSKTLALDIALFHVASPYPGTPFFEEVAKNGWFRAGVRWEDVNMDECTVIDYPHLSAERLEYWQKRAFREWALRPRPMLTYARMLLSDVRTIRSAVDIGLQHLTWRRGHAKSRQITAPATPTAATGG
jgi:anaerobic magnesium-protoporphyrin IX monomethyl ester cyclase